MADSGTYVCTASNKLGSVTAITTLGFQRQKFGNDKNKAYTSETFYRPLFVVFFSRPSETSYF